MPRRVFARVDHTQDLSDSEQRQQSDQVYSAISRYNVGSVAIVQGHDTWVEVVGSDSEVTSALDKVGNTQYAAGPPTNLSDQSEIDQYLDDIYVEAACDCRHWDK